MGAALSAACGDDSSDSCDSDVGMTDSDTGASADPPGRGADSCDSDDNRPSPPGGVALRGGLGGPGPGQDVVQAVVASWQAYS